MLEIWVGVPVNEGLMLEIWVGVPENEGLMLKTGIVRAVSVFLPTREGRSS
jgi:hypothetical protein